jgi:hypothetical protein
VSLVTVTHVEWDRDRAAYAWARVSGERAVDGVRVVATT